MCLGYFVIMGNRIGIMHDRKFLGEKKGEGEDRLSRLTYSLRSHIASRAHRFTFPGLPQVARYPKRGQSYGEILTLARISRKIFAIWILSKDRIF